MGKIFRTIMTIEKNVATKNLKRTHELVKVIVQIFNKLFVKNCDKG
jgi:hypothetical protein